VPPHSFNLDFPHLMLRYRAVEAKHGAISLADHQLAATDRNGKLASLAAPIANWASDTANHLTRPLLSKFAGLHPDAALPKYAGQSLELRAARAPLDLNRAAPGFGRKAVLYATCHGNYNAPEVGLATRAVLALNGVETEIVYPGCCGMPLLEQGEIAQVADAARLVAGELAPWIARGYDVIALVPSCALMLKAEWPLILPDDATVKTLAAATYDITEYIVDIAKKTGLTPGLTPLPGGVTVHMACHARAQNIGQKAAEMLRLIPEADVQVIERCSGHGGSWGFKNEHFPTALKVGRPAARTARDAGKAFITSECPLAGVHIMQGIDRLPGDAPKPERITHPIQLLARAYGISA
jgi:glycerol-3-phosphate dehydrogenase subunit C